LGRVVLYWQMIYHLSVSHTLDNSPTEGSL
jgi:hypothetical protein